MKIKNTNTKGTKVAKKMGKFDSISQLVVFHLSKNPNMPYEKLTMEVMRLKPKSKWGKTHYAWYKSAIKSNRVKAIRTAKKATA